MKNTEALLRVAGFSTAEIAALMTTIAWIGDSSDALWTFARELAVLVHVQWLVANPTGLADQSPAFSALYPNSSETLRLATTEAE